MKLVEGIDYTLENGKLVFTSEFLLKRGYCCNSRCRNCPYKQPENKREDNSSQDN